MFVVGGTHMSVAVPLETGAEDEELLELEEELEEVELDDVELLEDDELLAGGGLREELELLEDDELLDRRGGSIGADELLDVEPSFENENGLAEPEVDAFELPVDANALGVDDAELADPVAVPQGDQSTLSPQPPTDPANNAHIAQRPIRDARP